MSRCLQLGDKLLELGRAEALWALDREAEHTVPDKGRENTNSTGNTKEDGVEVLLIKAVVLKEDAGMGVNIGPWVLSLSLLEKDWGHNLQDMSE